MTFEPFPKIARLNRECVITEKIDGTNAQVWVRALSDFVETAAPLTEYHIVVPGYEAVLMAGSRNRWLKPGDDNYGFAAWVNDNRKGLAALGPGRHFGEWWGQGIQRTYGLKDKRFSLFNVSRWSDPDIRPLCCHVVPTIYSGVFNTSLVNDIVSSLTKSGSLAAPGFMKPEGVVVYHTAQNSLFKVTCENDESPKGKAAA